MKTVISPNTSWALEWKEISSSKELLYFFTWRNFKIRYKQTLLGALWAIIRPFVLMVVFTLIFNRGAGIEIEGDIPYPIFSYAGLLFWSYFSQTVTQVSTSLVTYQNIIKRIYFPRLLVPVSTGLTGIIDFAMSALVFVGILFFYQYSVGALGVILFIPLLVMALITVLGVGMFFAALNVRYRDVEQAMPFLVQVLLFLTPVIYPVTSVPDAYQWILFLNPMTGIIEIFRYTLLGSGNLVGLHIAISAIMSLAFLIFGVLFFKSQERRLGDYI